MANNFSNALAYWPFNSDNLGYDALVSGHDLTENAVSADTVTYKYGDASCLFNAPGDYLTITAQRLQELGDWPFDDTGGVTTVSVMAWVRCTAIRTVNYIYTKGLGLYVASANSHFNFWLTHSGGVEYHDTGIDITINQWYFVAFTYDAASKAYGVWIYDETGDHWYSDTGTSTYTAIADEWPLYIGNNTGGSWDWRGQIDNMVVFDTTITEDDAHNAKDELYPSGVSQWDPILTEYSPELSPQFNDLELLGDLVIGDDLTIGDDLNVTGAVAVTETLDVTGAVDFSSTLNVDGAITNGALTASLLLSTDASKVLTSVSDLTNWIAGTANQITVTDDGDGTVTLSTPQDIHTAATPTFGGVVIADDGWVGTSGGTDDVWVSFDSTNAYLTLNSDGGSAWFGANTSTPRGPVDIPNGLVVDYGTDNVLVGTQHDNTGSGGGTLKYCMFLGRDAGKANVSMQNCFGLGAFVLTAATDAQNCIGLGANALKTVDGASQMTGVGSASLGNVVEGSGCTGVGFYAGNGLAGTKYNTTCIGNNAGRYSNSSNLLIIDCQNRTDAAGEAAGAPIYGLTSTTPANQYLKFNVGYVQVLEDAWVGADSDCAFHFDATGSQVTLVDALAVTGLITGATGAKLGDGGTTNYVQIAADGEITLAGNARVYQNEWMDATAFRIPAAGSAATADDYGISFAWKFTDGSDDIIYATKRIPQDMDRTVACELKIGWGTDVVNTALFARWQLEYLWVAAGEDLTAAAQETLTVDSYAIAQADGLIIATITGIDLPSSTDQLLVARIKRLGSADTLGSDAWMVGAGLKYVKDKLGVAL